MAIKYVDNTLGTGANDGSSWANAFRNPNGAANPALWHCLQNVLTGDEIWVKGNGTNPYKPGNATGAPVDANTFTMVSGVDMYGGFAGTETLLSQRDPAANVTILSGDIDNITTIASVQNSDHVVWIEDTDVIVDGFTVIYGSAHGTGQPGEGGGIHIEDCGPTINNCIIKWCAGRTGGGLYVAASSEAVVPVLTNLTITKCYLREAGSASGGGGMAIAGGRPSLTNVTFDDCWAGQWNGGTPIIDPAAAGGGLYCTNHGVDLDTITFKDCHAAEGGGLHVSMTAVKNITVVDTAFINNEATDAGTGLGGGVNIDTADFTFTRCDFWKNTSDNRGGGVRINISNPIGNNNFVDCRFWDNTASIEGGGMIVNGGADIRLRRCLFAFNEATTTAGGGMWVQGASAGQIINCEFVGNKSVSGGGYYDEGGADDVMQNTLFTGNYASNGGGIYSTASGSLPYLKNVTALRNYAVGIGGGIAIYTASDVNFQNCIFRGGIATNGADIATSGNSSVAIVEQTNIEGGFAAIYTTDSGSKTDLGNNTQGDPKFVAQTSGNWTSAPTYNSVTGKTTYTDSGGGLGGLAGLQINLDTTQYREAYIESSTDTTVVVLGDWTSIAINGDPYQAYSHKTASDGEGVDTGENSFILKGETKAINGEWRIQDGIVDKGCSEYTPTVGGGAQRPMALAAM